MNKKIWIYLGIFLIVLLAFIVGYNINKNKNERPMKVINIESDPIVNEVKNGMEKSKASIDNSLSILNLKNNINVKNCMKSRESICSVSVSFASNVSCKIGDMVNINDYKCVCVDVCPKNAQCEAEQAWECSRTLADTEKITCCGSGINEFCLTVAKAKEANFSCQNNCQWDGKQFYNCKSP